MRERLYLRVMLLAAFDSIPSEIHGIPTIGLAVLVVVGFFALKALLGIIKKVLILAVCLLAVIFFAPQLIGKERGEELQAKAGTAKKTLTACVENRKAPESKSQAVARCSLSNKQGAQAKKAATAAALKASKSAAAKQARQKAEKAAKQAAIKAAKRKAAADAPKR